VDAPPQKKKIRRNLQGKFVSTPQAEEELVFRIFFDGRGRFGVVNLVLLACVLTATTQRSRQLFKGKSEPPRENPGYAYADGKWHESCIFDL